MSVRPDPVIPETRRRRASTTEKSERILKMSRSLTLTRSVLAGTLAEATPNQLDFIERWFTAELDSRERSKRLRLLKQAGFPADKTLDGYDWTNLKMPADWGRAQLVFCQIEVVQNGVSIQSEKAAGFSPVERKDPPPLLFGFYPIRAWVRLYDSPSNLIILP